MPFDESIRDAFREAQRVVSNAELALAQARRVVDALQPLAQAEDERERVERAELRV